MGGVMARSALALVFAAALTSTGCLGLFGNQTPQPAPTTATGAPASGLLNDIGYSFYCRGDLVTAENFLRKAVQNDHSLKAAWLNLGLVVSATGRLDEGFTAFQKAGSEGEAHANLAFVLAAQGKTSEAKA